MPLPKIDNPIYDLILPLSKKQIRFRPFLVKEQKNLFMAMESGDRETIEKNIKQVLHNCTLNDDIDIDKLPVLDIEYYFIQLRARSIGEVVDNKYRCDNEVEGKKCGNIMEVSVNLLDLQVTNLTENKDEIQITNEIYVKLKYPEYSILRKLSDKTDVTDIAFEMIVDSIEHVYDGEQYYYASEVPKQELMEFIESLNQQQFSKIEEFFTNLPKLEKKIQIKCSRCGFDHSLDVEGLESFFG